MKSSNPSLYHKLPDTQADPSKRFDDVETIYSPDIVIEASVQMQTMIFKSTIGVSMRLVILSDDILRISYAVREDFERDFSYAIDPNFEPTTVLFTIRETKLGWAISTEKLVCHVAKKGMKVKITDKNGRLLSEEAKGFCHLETVLRGTTKVSIRKKAFPNEAFMGMGDKAEKQNLRGKSTEQWCTDAFAYWEDTKQTYRAVPFYYSLREGHSYGIFLDNTYHTHFDFDSNKNGVCEFAALGGQMNYYFIHGPNPNDVTRRYATLTGRHAMPPIWALGYHQCRWSYFPEKRVMEIAETFREKKIPCDAIYLDIDYMDNYRCFTWHPQRFPNPGQMMSKLGEMGFKTVVMIDPGIKVERGYPVFDEGLKAGHFCKRADGSLFKGAVWPGECAFPDFTKKETRDWWASLYKGLIEDGVDGFWNDMNEPAVFEVNHKTMPDDVMHDYDGTPTHHRKAHNIYGMQMSKATSQGLAKHEGERTFLLTRASFSGGQRYAAVWTGDNIACWEHLRFANRQCVRMSISGFSFVGTDIGGFVNVPDPELYVRWLQLSVFHPLMRTHTMGDHLDGSASIDEELVLKRTKAGNSNQEPWSFGDEAEALARKAIELRYQLLAYLYNSFYQHHTYGEAILRPLVFDYPNDLGLLDCEREFMFGRDILVSNVDKKGAKTQLIYLPSGDWYDYFTKKKFQGGKSHRIKLSKEYLPMFVKAGAVIPVLPARQHTGEPLTHVTFKVFPNQGKRIAEFYFDSHLAPKLPLAGESFSITNENGVVGAIDQKRVTEFLQKYGLGVFWK